jgi:hypothetical protein
MKIQDFFNASDLQRKLFLASVLVLFFLCAVVPNSMQLASVAVLFFCALLSLKVLTNSAFWPLFCLHLLISATTLIYIIMGHMNGAPDIALTQTLFVYIVSPFLWTLTLGRLMYVVKDERIIFWAAILAAFALASIAIFYYMFINLGVESVRFFISAPNVTIEDGQAGATMFVYGSLIFLSAGFFAAPQIIRNMCARYVLLAALVAAALSSGRSALLLAVVIGISVGVIARIGSVKSGVRIIKSGIALVVLGTPLMAVYLNYSEIDFVLTLRNVFWEILSGGGLERREQLSALLIGINENKGLGSGHGVGVPYLRSEEYPWRYELVWVATVLRVGILGATVYALPFLYFLWLTLKRLSTTRPSDPDVFFLAGFISGFVASNTNPYIESFVFQWMMIFPVVRLVAVDTLSRSRDT